MSEFQIKSETIKDYLLGRISDEKLLGEMEDLLFSDDEFCDQVELIEDGLINDYSFGKLNAKDTADFENSLENNPERRSKVEFVGLLKEKAKAEIKVVAEKSSFLDSIKAFLAQPIYAGVFGLLLIAVLFSAFYFLMPNTSDELAGLKDIYKTERPTTSRVSGFEYAPYIAERSENSDDANKNKLRLIENALLEAVEKNENAATLHALGVFYLTQQKYVDAITNLQKAVELSENNPNYRNDLGTAYFEFAKNGDKAKRLENFALANEEFSKAYELDNNLNEALFNKSLVLESLSLQTQAVESWNNYLKKDANSKWAEEARKNLERLKQKEQSFKTKDQVLDEFLIAFRKKDEARIWQIHTQTKGIFNGVSLQQQLTQGYIDSRLRKDEKSANENLEALKQIGELEKVKHADFFFAELSEYYSKIDESDLDELSNAKKLLTDGIDLVKQGKFTDSIEQFEASKQAFLKIGNEVESNIAELWAAEMLPDVGKIEESGERLNSLIEASEKNNYKIFLPISYYWLSVGKFRQEKFSDGIKDKKKASQIAFNTENVYESKHINESLAVTYNYLGEFDESLKYLSKASDKVDDFYLNESQTWRNLFAASQLFEKLNFNYTAMDVANESVNFSRAYLAKTPAFDSSLLQFIKALSKNKKFDEALKVADESNEIALNKGDKAENYKVIANSFLERANLKSSMENCTEALNDFDKSLEYYEKIPEITFEIYQVRKGRLLCFQQMQRQSEFQKELEIVLKLSEELRQKIREDNIRQTFFESEQIIFDLAIMDALKEKNSRKAFEFLEKSKSRSLLEFIKSKDTIAQIENDFSLVTNPLKIEEIQSRMSDKVQIVQYSMQDEKLAIWLLTNKKFELVDRKINLVEVETKINKYQKDILTKKDNKATAIELYNLLIPVGLDKNKTICFVLDKSLHNIPFASLISPNGKYLLEEFEIFYSPSSSVFLLASENAKQRENLSNEKLLSIGNPTFDREENSNLADLPSAGIEAEQISKDYTNSEVYVGEKATKESFLKKIDNTEIIHFAGHFVANGQSPSNSKLVFSDENLRSFELSDKKLNRSKLVILSACETAYEAINKSEGAIGIGRTFLALGTPIVVASNWKVDSEATKDLMIDFHQKRRVKKYSTIKALRESQLELLSREETKSPYYWSAFSAIGGFANY